MVVELRADELIPGDVFDTRCGVGDTAFHEITNVRVIENDAPGQKDRIEIRYASDSISPTRTLLADSKVRVRI